MGRNPNPCCSKEEMKRGAWSLQEDLILTDFIKANGEGRWRNLPKQAGLRRCGKSCRLRWLNYLRPHIKRGNISSDEEDLIIRLHNLLGNRWSLIAGRLPGRTDNEIKNYWNTNLGKKVHKNNTTTNTITSFPLPAQHHKLQVPAGSAAMPSISRMMTNSYDGDKETTKEVMETPCYNTDNNFSPEDLVMDFNAGELSCLSDLLYSDHPLLYMLLDDYWTSLN